MSEKRYSNCCYALPFDELWESEEADGSKLYTGRCSKCKDGAAFFTDKEFELEENRLQRPFDPEMGMGGAGYNDTMFGAGDELEHERDDD